MWPCNSAEGQQAEPRDWVTYNESSALASSVSGAGVFNIIRDFWAGAKDRVFLRARIFSFGTNMRA